MKKKKMRSKKAIGIMLAVIIAVSVFTAVIPGIASESLNTIVTVDISSASKATSILQIENVKSNLTDAQKKLSTDLLQLVNSNFLPPGQNRETLEIQMKNLGQFRPASSVPKADGRVAGDLVYVYIYLKPPAGTRTIEPYVWEITDRDEENHLAVAWVEVKDLETLASLEAVRTIRTVMPPLVRTGSVTTEGDAIHRTSDVRTTYSQNGSGVKVGIISDGVDNWASAQSSGDLPAGLTVLSNTQSGDEGTAMLEIVHDMVPGADLYFHDCGDNVVAFNAAIDALVTAGCDVICDDIGWILEPFFEDGIVASHLTSVLASNDIIYVSSAGNAGQRHYQGDYYNIPSSTQHDFSRGGTTGYYLYLQMQAGGSVRIVLQWNDQFGSSGNDYDLYLYNIDTSTTVAQSTATQDGDDDPLEFISYTVPGGTPTADYAIIVDKYSGVGKTLEVFIYPRNGAGVYTNNIDPIDSIFGHAAVTNAIAVGAINASDPGNDDIEFFSSQGPVTISYPSPVSRPKPDLCGIDGVTVTGAGGFPSPFYGTSAAAPHIAAIAAQLWGAFHNKTGNEIRTTLYSSAVDLGSAGYDNVFGYGRADALDAFEAIVPLTITAFNPPSPANDTVCNWRTFNVTVNQTVNVSWYLNESFLFTNESITEANCMLHAEVVGEHNVSAVATNENGTDRQMWIWNVTSAPDTTPPASITNLQNITGTTWINWTWTNPPDGDFNYTMVYLNGTLKTNTSASFYNATTLNPDTYYEIGTHTVDKVGNINSTWVNQTTKTKALLLTLNITNAKTDKSTYNINENVTISCIVQNETGYNITADIVDAEILKPDSSIEWLSLIEGLVGHYNGTFTNTSLNGTYNVTIYANKTGYANDTAELSFFVIPWEEVLFDTGEGTYPSIMGIHNGTITPKQTITVHKLYTYPCPGTGGHSEYVAFYNTTTGAEIANGTWNGYQGAGDYHYIIFKNSFMLEKEVTYNYTIRTGSYPQIHHTPALPTANGWINCTEFIDANGKTYTDWIPAIRLE